MQIAQELMLVRRAAYSTFVTVLLMHVTGLSSVNAWIIVFALHFAQSFMFQYFFMHPVMKAIHFPSWWRLIFIISCISVSCAFAAYFSSNVQHINEILHAPDLNSALKSAAFNAGRSTMAASVFVAAAMSWRVFARHGQLIPPRVAKK